MDIGSAILTGSAVVTLGLTVLSYRVASAVDKLKNLAEEERSILNLMQRMEQRQVVVTAPAKEDASDQLRYSWSLRTRSGGVVSESKPDFANRDAAIVAGYAAVSRYPSVHLTHVATRLHVTDPRTKVWLEGKAEQLHSILPPNGRSNQTLVGLPIPDYTND